MTGCFLPIFNLWSFKLFYDSRYYVGDDIWHRLYEVAVLVATATAVVHIQPVTSLSNPAVYSDMFFFLVSLLSASILSAGRMLEVMLCQKRGTPGLYPEAFMAARDVVTLLFPMLFYAAAAIYTGLEYYGDSSYSAEEAAFLSNGDEALNSTSYDEDVGAGGTRALAESSYAAEDDIAIWLCLGGALCTSTTLVFLVLF